MRFQTLVLPFAALALVAGCSSTGTDQSMASESTTSSTTGTTASTDMPQAPGSSGYGAGTAASRNDGAGGVAPQASGTLESATVVSVEPVPRAGIGTMGTTGTSGTMGSSGSAGSTASQLQSYRVTLRLDDGSTRVVTQDWQPRFGAGERVQLENGQIQNR